MKKRVFVVHCWDGYPEYAWYPWIKQELDNKGFDVFVLEMPETNYPKIENWVPFIAKNVEKADENTFFIGHSVGCNMIARYLESLPENGKVGGVVFVAGYFRSLTNLDSEEEKKVTRPWLEVPVDFEKIKKCMKNSIAIFSDNDKWVPAENIEDFKDKLGSKIIIFHNRGHFSKEDGCALLPEARDALLEIAG